MSAQKLRPRLADMLLAMDRIDLVIRGLERDAFVASFEKQWLVESGVEIVYEEARHIPQDLLMLHPQIQWSDIKAIGNRLRHDYGRIDPHIMWTIATIHLPDLKPVINQMLSTLDAGPAS